MEGGILQHRTIRYRYSWKGVKCACAIATVIVGLPSLLKPESGVGGAPHLSDQHVAPATLNNRTACLANPYRESVDRTFDSIIEEEQDWLNTKRARAEIRAMRSGSDYSQHDHLRRPPVLPLRGDGTLQRHAVREGTCSEDNSKYACGVDCLAVLDDCTVYAIGSHNRWHFESDLLLKTTCQIHTFDCTGPRSRFKPPFGSEGRTHFHHLCLGATPTAGIGNDSPKCVDKRPPPLCGDEIHRYLGHDRVDLLKIDIEGWWEWPIFDVETTDASMPMQLLIEVHYGGGWGGTAGVIHDRGTRSTRDIIRFQSHLLGLGYVVANRDDNPHCPHCTKLTLLRVAC